MSHQTSVTDRQFLSLSLSLSLSISLVPFFLPSAPSGPSATERCRKRKRGRQRSPLRQRPSSVRPEEAHLPAAAREVAHAEANLCPFKQRVERDSAGSIFAVVIQRAASPCEVGSVDLSPEIIRIWRLYKSPFTRRGQYKRSYSAATWSIYLSKQGRKESCLASHGIFK